MNSNNKLKNNNLDSVHVKCKGVYHKSAGGIVLYKNGGLPKIALLQWKEKNGWAFPKGHIKTKETTKQAARREVQEELGIPQYSLPIKKLGVEHTAFKLPKDNRVHYKQTHIYIFLLNKKYQLTPNRAEHFINAKWLTLDRAENVMKQSPFVKDGYLQIRSHIVKKKYQQTHTTRSKEHFKE